MSDGITDAAKADQQSFYDWKKKEIQTFLSMRTPKELIDELAKRDGVKTYMIPDKQLWRIECSDNGMYIDNAHHGYGAARILVVKNDRNTR